MRGGSAIVILWLSLSCLLGCDVGANARAAEDEARNGASEKRARDDVGQPALRAYTRWRADRDDTAAERMRGAAARRDAVVRALFAEAGVAYPPAELVFRVFKEEGELEVWAGGERLALVARYAVCAASGDPGPKRREGDHQVPEGFYRIASYNPASRFHLAMLVSYPNASDRVLSHPTEPGGEIMIHGACASVGCLAMSDERAEELWLMARSRARPVHVIILPGRDIDAFLADADHAEHHAFWRELKQGNALFERDRKPVRFRVDADGHYRFSP